MKHSLAKDGNKALAKLVVATISDRVVGMHCVGAEAAEIIQVMLKHQHRLDAYFPQTETMIVALRSILCCAMIAACEYQRYGEAGSRPDVESIQQLLLGRHTVLDRQHLH